MQRLIKKGIRGLLFSFISGLVIVSGYGLVVLGADDPVIIYIIIMGTSIVIYLLIELIKLIK